MSRRESREYQNLYEVTETFNEGSQRSEPRSGTSPNKKKISLLNFDPNCRLSHFLSSPLSIEACKVLGIEEWELLARSKKDFRYENIPSKFKDYKEEFLDLKAEHYEKCRLERLQNCIETRKKLYAKSLAKYQSNDSVANPMSYRSYKDEANLSLIMSPKKILETGRKHLTATKRKQNQEIELIMEIEDMKERLDTRMGDHMQRVTEIKESKKAEFERRKNEAQEEKVRREQRKVEIEKERERSLRRRLNYSLLDDKESKGDISLLDNSITIHSARGPAGEIPKLRMFATSDNLKKRSTSIQGAEELRKQIGEKLYSSKIEKSEGIKKSLDQQRKARLEDRRVSSDAKHEERQRSKSIKEEAKTLERERNYMDKLENNKRNKQRISEDKEVERREKSRRETEHAEQIRDKVRQGERELETKNQQLFEDLEIDLSRAEKQKKDTLSERRYLYMMNHLKEEEAKGNMRRKEKMLKYQEKKVGERIEAHSNRVTSRSREREMIAKENANVIRGLSQEKLQLKEGFAQLKKQLDKEHFNKYYASPSQLSTFRSVLSCRSESSSKYVKSRPRSPEQKDSARGKRETMAYLTDSGFSTPLRKLRAPSHERTRSGSKTLASSRRFQEERSSLAGISVNTSYEMKEKKTQGVKDEVLEPGLPVLDEEGALFAGKAFSIRSARKIGIEELIRTLDSEIKAQPKTQSTFKKSAEAIMNIVKLHNEYTENLMQETSYLDLPWASFNANKP